MKKLVYFLFSLALFAGCASSEKLLEKGEYDKALRKAVKKLRKKPDKMDEIYVADQAYHSAMRVDSQQVVHLKKEGDPENYEEIYNIYRRMKERQELVQTLPPIGVEFRMKDLDNEMVSAKENAAEYAYAKGVRLLNKSTREDARLAYAEFQKVKRYYDNYKDVDEKMKEAKHLGTSNVLFRIENNTNVILPEGFEEELKKINLEDLNSMWLNHDTRFDSTKYYDYYIQLSITTIEVSPEMVKENEYTERKKVEDGWEYALDENGNVKQDTAGNDIKKPKYKTLQCTVIESAQKKAATVTGNIDYIRTHDDELLKSEPLAADAIFEHHSAVAVGDKAALSEESLEKTRSKPAPFPPDEVMIMDAANVLKGMTKDLIYKNKGLLK